MGVAWNLNKDSISIYSLKADKFWSIEMSDLPWKAMRAERMRCL